MAEIYGEGRTTVPGLLIDGEPVHGSRPILERLEALEAEPPLYPEPIADAVREAERWGDEELQDLGRRLPWGALHFRPESLGTFGGAGPLDPAGTDFAIRMGRASWKYHGITAQRLAEDLAGLPAKLDRVDALAEAGTIGGDAPERRRPADRRDAARAALPRRPAAAARGPRGRARRPRVVPGLRGRHPGRGVPGRVGAVALTLGAELLLVAAGDDRGPLDRLAGLDRPRQPHELRVRPRQRRRRARALAVGLVRRAAVPDLLGQHHAVVGRAGDRLQPRARVLARDQLVLAALARQQRPRAPERLPRRVVEEQVPVAAVRLLAVAVEREAAPELRRSSCSPFSGSALVSSPTFSELRIVWSS